MAEDIQTYLRERMPQWKNTYAGVEELKVAVMGCVVNGPGESKHANIGISLPGTFEEPRAPVYVDGQAARDAARRRDRGGVSRYSGSVCRAALWRRRNRSRARLTRPLQRCEHLLQLVQDAGRKARGLKPKQ